MYENVFMKLSVDDYIKLVLALDRAVSGALELQKSGSLSGPDEMELAKVLEGLNTSENLLVRLAESFKEQAKETEDRLYAQLDRLLSEMKPQGKVS